MKKLWKWSALAVLMLAAVGCDKEQSDPMAEPQLEVTANNLQGIWRLTEWSDSGLAEGTYVYIEFTRRDQLFTIYQNLDSFSARKITGRYNIMTDDEFGAIIRGQYDFGNGDWQHRYIIRGLTRSEMTWIAKDDPAEVKVYVRCDALPGDILDELPATE